MMKTKRVTRASHGVRVHIENVCGYGGALLVYPDTKGMKALIRERSETPEVITQGALIQDSNGYKALMEDLTPRAKRELKAGWSVRAYINDERAMCLFGIAY